MKTAFRFELEKIDKHRGGAIIGCHPDGLKLMRKSGLFKKYIHYWEENSRTVRYNKQALEHGAIYGFDSPEHLQFIDNFVRWAESLAGKR